MDLTVNLPEDAASELRLEAARQGIDAPSYASQIIRAHLPAARAEAARALFAQWDADDATDDPVELSRRQSEWEELRSALNNNRTSGRRLFAE